MTTRKSSARPATTAKTAAPKRVAAPKAKAGAKKAAPAAESAGAKARHKLVRDSYTIPKSEYELLDALKRRAAHLERPVKKSELLRAGIAALSAMTDKALLMAVNAVPSLKTGRPKGD